MAALSHVDPGVRWFNLGQSIVSSSPLRISRAALLKDEAAGLRSKLMKDDKGNILVDDGNHVYLPLVVKHLSLIVEYLEAEDCELGDLLIDLTPADLHQLKREVVKLKVSALEKEVDQELAKQEAGDMHKTPHRAAGEGSRKRRWEDQHFRNSVKGSDATHGAMNPDDIQAGLVTLPQPGDSQAAVLSAAARGLDMPLGAAAATGLGPPKRGFPHSAAVPFQPSLPANYNHAIMQNTTVGMALAMLMASKQSDASRGAAGTCAELAATPSTSQPAFMRLTSDGTSDNAHTTTAVAPGSLPGHNMGNGAFTPFVPSGTAPTVSNEPSSSGGEPAQSSGQKAHAAPHQLGSGERTIDKALNLSKVQDDYDVDLDAITDPEERRKQRRLIKNRRSAASHRERKKMELQALQARVAVLESENQQLRYLLACRDVELQQLKGVAYPNGAPPEETPAKLTPTKVAEAR